MRIVLSISGEQSDSMHFQLKQEFDIVKTLRGLSGFGWDDERKIVTASSDVWDAYIEVRAF